MGDRVMYKKIELKVYSVSPQHWKNLIDYLIANDQVDDEGATIAAINYELKQFDARYIDSDINTYASVEFENEEGYIMYLLKWG